MISVVIPAFDEQDAIADEVAGVARVLDDAGLTPYEIVVVDDGSADETARRAEQAGARVIRHPQNLGYGRSLKDGIAAASHDTIVITDGDGTYPADRIPDLVARYREGFDMVVGQRTGRHYRQSPLKWPLRVLLRFLVEWTAGRRIPDVNSGLRVFSRDTVTGYAPHLCDTFSFTTSVTLAYMMTGRTVGYVPVAYHERVGRSKVQHWRDSLRTLQFIVQAITYYNPIKIFLLMSLVCLVISAVSIAGGIALHLATALMLGVGAALVAIVVFALGLLADLLRQILFK